VFDKYKFNSPSTKRIIFDEASSSQWGIYLSAYNALTKSLNGANTMGNGASVTSYAMRFSGANSAAEGFILKIPSVVLLEIKSVTSTTSAADSILHARGSAIIDGDYPQGSGYHPRLMLLLIIESRPT
jgi:hypothetical protein